MKRALTQLGFNSVSSGGAYGALCELARYVFRVTGSEALPNCETSSQKRASRI
jgi:hypothetical protein